MMLFFAGFGPRLLTFLLCVPLIIWADVGLPIPTLLYLIGAFFLLSGPLLLLDFFPQFLEKIPVKKGIWQWFVFLVSSAPLGYGMVMFGRISYTLGMFTIGGCCILYAITYFVASRRFATTSFYVNASVSVITLSTALIAMHYFEGTFVGVKPGTEKLRLGLFLGTWLISIALIPSYTVRAMYSKKHETPIEVARATIVFSMIVGLIVGVILLEADRTMYVGLYTNLHYWLEFIGLGALQAFLVPIIYTKITTKKSRITIASLSIIMPFVLLFWMALAPGVSSYIFRASVENSVRSSFPLSLSRGTQLKVGEQANHKSLQFQRFEDRINTGEKQNIIIISIDTLRGDYVGEGEPYEGFTPKLSALAKQSLTFDYAYAPGNRTAIGMGAFLLGRYSAEIDWELWIWWNGNILNPKKYDEAAKKKMKGFGYTTIPKFPKGGTIAQRIQKAGYYTIGVPYTSVGKFFAPGIGFEKGFDYYELPKISKRTPNSGKVFKRALKALDKARAEQEKPIFLWVHLFDPHESRAKREKYDKLVKQTDDAVGEFIEALKSRGLWDKTAIIVLADHGEGLGEHRLKHHGASLYDEQVRVPFMVRLPGKKGRRIPSVASTIDGAITAVALAGGETKGMTGVNLIPVLDGEAYPIHRPVFTEMHRYRGGTGRASHDGKAIIMDGWKLYFNRKRSWIKLFNLKTDPEEKVNLLATETKRANELLFILSSFINPRERKFPLPSITPPPLP